MAVFKTTFDTEAVAAQSDSGGAFEPMPDGVYEFSIYEAEVKEYGPNSSNAGRPRLDVTLVVPSDADKFSGRRVWDTVPLFPVWKSGSQAFAFKQFFGTALGLLDDSGELAFDPDELLGVRIKAVLKTEPAKDGNPARNRVARYVASESEVKIAEPAKATPAAPPGRL